MNAQTEAPALPQKERWQEAVKVIRAQGITARQNARKCCRGCLTIDLNNELGPDARWAFTYGSQLSGFRWDSDTIMMKREGRGAGAYKAEGVYWYFKSEGVAQIVKDAFEAQGFTVDWDGSPMQAVRVLVNKADA